jgi:hypothetical protein
MLTRRASRSVSVENDSIDRHQEVRGRRAAHSSTGPDPWDAYARWVSEALARRG